MSISRITGFHKGDDGHWVADLDCGHSRHVRHQPPFSERPWAVTEAGRAEMLGAEIECGLCRQGVPVEAKGKRT